MVDIFPISVVNPNDSLGSLLDDCLPVDSTINCKDIQELNEYTSAAVYSEEDFYKTGDFVIANTIEINTNELPVPYVDLHGVSSQDEYNEWDEPIYIKTNTGYLAIPRLAAIRALSASDAQLNEPITAHLINEDFSEHSSNCSAMEWTDPCPVPKSLSVNHEVSNVIMEACHAAGLENVMGSDIDTMLNDNSAMTESTHLKSPKRKKSKNPPTKPIHKGGWPKGFKRKCSFGILRPPKHQKTACSLYLVKTLEKMKDSGEHVTQETIRTIYNRWKTLSDQEKQPYFDLAAKDKARFMSEMEIYRKKYKEKEAALIEEHKQAGLQLDDSSLAHRFELLGPNLRCDLCDKNFTKLHSKYEHLKSKKHQENVIALNKRLKMAVTMSKKKQTLESKKKNKNAVVDDYLDRLSIKVSSGESEMGQNSADCSQQTQLSTNGQSAESMAPSILGDSRHHTDIDEDADWEETTQLSSPQFKLDDMEAIMEFVDQANIDRQSEIERLKENITLIIDEKDELTTKKNQLEKDLNAQKESLANCRSTIDRLTSEQQYLLKLIKSTRTDLSNPLLKRVPSYHNPKQIKLIPIKRLPNQSSVYRKSVKVNGRVYNISVS